MKRALLLRAQEDAARTEEKLRAAGFAPVVSPVLQIVATGAKIPAGDYDAVLASSAKGVALAQDADAFKASPFHAVGAKTAEAARASGWRPDIVAGAAESILPLLLARYAAAPARFLYLAGRDRQPALEAGLRAAGHDVVTVEVYEARAATALAPEAIAAIAAKEIDAALHYSRRSAEIFLALAHATGLSRRLPAIAHVALSEDVASPLRYAGLQARVALTPDEAGLLTALRAI